MNGMFRLTQALWQFQRYSSYELTKDENRLKTQQNMSAFLKMAVNEVPPLTNAEGSGLCFGR